MSQVSAQLPDHLSRTLDLVQRAAKAGSALNCEQLRARLGFANQRNAQRAVRELHEMGFVALDKSTRPTLIKPAGTGQ